MPIRMGKIVSFLEYIEEMNNQEKGERLPGEHKIITYIRKKWKKMIQTPDLCLTIMSMSFER